MLHFQPLTPEQIPLVREDLARPVPRTCDFSVGGIVIWRDFFHVEYARIDRSMIYRITLPDGLRAFQTPADPDPRLLQAIWDHCRETGEPCRFALVPAERLSAFDALPGEKTVTSQREWADYLYEKDDLIFYRGKKLRGQRNHVNKFLSSHGDWTFEEGSAQDPPRLREFYQRFKEENQKDAPTWIEEEHKMQEIFDRFEEYGFLCGILTVQGRVAGFSLGERVGDTLTVHTEKADRNIPGAYPMLCSQFTKAFAGEAIRYVNREDDSGDEGLRTAKLSYHPCAILEKYFIEINE